MIGIEKSICKGGWLHRFVILSQSPYWVEEGCLICRKKVYFKIIEGRIDNLNYAKCHIRQGLPKNHRLFYHEFPKK